MRLALLLVAVVSGSLTGCAADRAGGIRNEVIVLGMIHGGHRTSASYGIDRVRQIVGAIEPDYILCEIPPGRLARALAEYRETGSITEPRVSVFPEYVDAIIPLTREMSFQLVPCAAWTQEMAQDRREKLARWKTERADDHAEMQVAQERASQRLEAEGYADDPLRMHTLAYDEIVRKGMEPYNRLFNDDLGLGGWDNINAAHYALIERALDQHTGEGKRFLITFGAWHKYWFLDELRKRDDIALRSLHEFIE